MANLRKKIVRLAYENPELRPHLLPLLKEAADHSVYREIVNAAEMLRSAQASLDYRLSGEGSRWDTILYPDRGGDYYLSPEDRKAASDAHKAIEQALNSLQGIARSLRKVNLGLR